MIDSPLQTSATGTTRAIDNAWWGMILTLFILIGIVASIFGLWRADAIDRSRSVERYFPIGAGTALSYKSTTPGSEPTYLSINRSRHSGLSALNLMPLELQAQVVADSLGISASDLTTEQYGEYLRSGAADLVLAQETASTFSTTGPVTVTNALYIVQPSQLAIVALDGQDLNPPAVVLDTSLAPGEQRVSTGMLKGTIPYTFTIRMEAVEAITVPVGAQNDCMRVLQDLELNATHTTSRTWFCAGLGIVRQQTQHGEQAGESEDLIGVSIPGMSLVAETPPVRDAGLAALPSDSAPPVSGEMGVAWVYRESGSSIHVTSPAALSQDELVFGTVTGRVVALDRQTRRPLWHFDTGGAVYAAPTIAAGMVLIGSADRHFYALDAETGAFRWSFAARDAISGGAVVAGDTVFFGSEDHAVYALDLERGAERWHVDTEGPIAGTPAIDGSTLYIGSDDGALYAIDTAQGDVRWAYATENAIQGRPVVYNGVVYVGSLDGLVYALSATPAGRDGEVLWTRDTNSSIETGVVVSDGLLIAQSSDDEVYGIDAESGDVRWIYRSERALRGTPILYGERILLNDTGQIVALTRDGVKDATYDSGTSSYPGLATDGHEIVVGHQNGYVTVLGDISQQPWESAARWVASGLETELFHSSDAIATSALDYGDSLILVSISGDVFQVSKADGSFERIGSSGISAALLPPAIEGDTLVLGDQYGAIMAFDLRQHAEMWRATVPGRSFSAPVFTQDSVIVASTHDKQASVAAFDRTSGAQKWHKDFAFTLAAGSSLVQHNDLVYVVANSVHALNPADGSEVWNENGAISPYQIAASNGKIFAIGYDASFNSYVATFDAATGKRTALVPASIDGIPTLHGGITAQNTTVLLAYNEGTLTALDATTGAMMWTEREPTAIGAPPVIDGDRVLYLAIDSRLLARKLSDGTLLSEFTLQDATSSVTESVAAPLIADRQIYAVFYQQAFALPLRATGGTQ